MNGIALWELKEILESEIEICERFSKAKSLSLRKRRYYEGRIDASRLILVFVNYFLGKDDGD